MFTWGIAFQGELMIPKQWGEGKLNKGRGLRSAYNKNIIKKCQIVSEPKKFEGDAFFSVFENMPWGSQTTDKKKYLQEILRQEANDVIYILISGAFCVDQVVECFL